MIPAITGVTMPSSTVLSVTWPLASMLPLAGAEGEADRLVVLAERAGRLGAGVLGVIGDTGNRHADAQLRDREHVRGVVRVDRHGRLAVELELRADDALRLGDERVAQARRAVEVVDRDVHERIGRH